MIDIQEEVKVLEAVKYITINPTLSFHHVATKFKVDVQKLQDQYRLSRSKRIENEELVKLV